MRARVHGLICAALLVLAAAPGLAAVIRVQSADSPGEGFNDPTPVTPVGGNTATTRGGQRLRVFEEAARVWGGALSSDVTILVEARFDPFACASRVLGAAGAATVAADFSNAQAANTWHHIALANRLAGTDLSPNGPDIRATFNSNVDQPGCLDGVWYYGLDHRHGNDYDLLAVVLHELGHGLGFSTLVDVQDGTEFQGRPDIFERHILDASTGERWHQMTDAERAASAVNQGNVVWDGAQVTAAATSVLTGRPFLRVNSPSDIAGERTIQLASFSPPPSLTGVTAEVRLAEPAIGCPSITNDMTGRIALIRRGGTNCSFVSKVIAAQNAGAAAVIVANNTGNDPPAMGGSPDGIVIPVVGITQSDGAALEARMASATVTATIAGDASDIAGLHANGRVQLYTPSPVEPGSSVSHWDVEALPDLLMEPFISERLSSDVDLTLQAMLDIGWEEGSGVPPPALPQLITMGAGFPNPFGSNRTGSSVAMPFSLDHVAEIEIRILDIDGRLVRTVFDGTLGSGPHNQFSWDGTDDDGRVVVSGIYFVHVRSGKESGARRIALVR